MSKNCTPYPQQAPTPLAEQLLLASLALAVLALLVFPAARGVSEALGWLPLWLLGLPGSAWAALRLRRWREQTTAQPARVPRGLALRAPAQVHRLRPPQARRVMPSAAERARAA
jgi:hypothetical protein